MPFKYRSEPLFNSGVLDMEEFQKRMEFWISYGKTGASKDVGISPRVERSRERITCRHRTGGTAIGSIGHFGAECRHARCYGWAETANPREVQSVLWSLLQGAIVPGLSYH